jgi:L,D-transpeptidase ErfK/SrfK
MALALVLAGCTTDENQALLEPPSPPPQHHAPFHEPDHVPSIYRIQVQDRVIGGTDTYVVREKDTLLDVARDYDFGYTQLITANRGIDPWAPPVGHPVTLPGRYLLPDVPRKGIVVNLVQHRLFYFRDDGTVETFPIGVGVEGHDTPLGVVKITKKEVHPVWHVPASIRAEDRDLPANVRPGPDNPLGDYAMRMGGTSFLIHGTNKPYGVGRNVSHGCVHLYPEDIEKLFKEVKIGTQVRIIDQEVLTAWVNGDLYVAVFPNKAQTEALDVNLPVPDQLPPTLREQVTKAAAGHNAKINWAEVEEAGHERSGIPVRVTSPDSGGNNMPITLRP